VNGEVSTVKGWFNGLIHPTYNRVAIAVNGAHSPTSWPGKIDNRGHLAGQAVDNHPNTFWVSTQGDGAVLNITFAKKVSIQKIRVWNGDPDDFTATDVPAAFVLVWSNGKSSDVELKDDGSPHTYDVDSSGGVTSVQVQIHGTNPTSKSTTPKNGLNPRFISVAEIQFLSKE
jgi:hypothetical protein